MSLVVILAQGFKGVGASLISVRGVRVGSTLATSVACLASRLFVVRCGATLRKELLPKGHHSYWSLPICNKPAHRYSLQGMSCGYITSGCTVDLIALGVASSANIIDIKHHERCLDSVCMCVWLCVEWQHSLPGLSMRLYQQRSQAMGWLILLVRRWSVVSNSLHRCDMGYSSVIRHRLSCIPWVRYRICLCRCAYFAKY